MKLKKLPILAFLIMVLLSGCNSEKIKSATFTNVTPAQITIRDAKYLVTNELLSSNMVENQIGEIKRIYDVVSYLEKDNPYKNPGKIYKLKNIDEQEAIAIIINNKLYRANKYILY